MFLSIDRLIAYTHNCMLYLQKKGNWASHIVPDLDGRVVLGKDDPIYPHDKNLKLYFNFTTNLEKLLAMKAKYGSSPNELSASTTTTTTSSVQLSHFALG